MKQLAKAIFVGLFCLFGASTASALDLSVSGTYWDVEDLDASWGAYGQLSEPIYENWVDVTLGAGYLRGEEGLADDSFQLVPMDLGLRVHLTEGCEVDPYLLGGASYVAVDNDTDLLPELDGNWGAYAGAGMAYPLDKRWDLFTDVIFRFVDLDTDDIPGHVDADGLQAFVGVKYSFAESM